MARQRFRILARDEFTCQYCGRQAPQVVLHMDHIVPQAKGGTDEDWNLLTSCQECNGGKSDIPVEKLPAIVVQRIQTAIENAAGNLENPRTVRTSNMLRAVAIESAKDGEFPVPNDLFDIYARHIKPEAFALYTVLASIPRAGPMPKVRDIHRKTGLSFSKIAKSVKTLQKFDLVRIRDTKAGRSFRLAYFDYTPRRLEHLPFNSEQESQEQAKVQSGS